jgi:hypothetical protein
MKGKRTAVEKFRVRAKPEAGLVFRVYTERPSAERLGTLIAMNGTGFPGISIRLMLSSN